MKNIVLIGFMGTGKTVVGRRLAHILGFHFVDVDTLIEKRERRTIGEIFQDKGEPYFRQVETQIIKEVVEKTNLVITTGGGAVLHLRNKETLLKEGWLVCLKATSEIIYERTRKRSNRPLIQGKDPLKKIQSLMKERSKCYAGVNLTIDTTSIKPDTIVKLILKAYRELPKNG